MQGDTDALARSADGVLPPDRILICALVLRKRREICLMNVHQMKFRGRIYDVSA